MGANQRRKGVSGELEVAHIFQKLGFSARRGIGQFQSASLVPDVVLDDLQQYWIEVKRGAQTAPFAALEQATIACKGKKIPLAICRNDGDKHAVTMYLYDWADIRQPSMHAYGFFGMDDQTTKVSIPIDTFLKYFAKKHADKCKQLTFKAVADTNPVASPVERPSDVGSDSKDISTPSEPHQEVLPGIKGNGSS
jgi:hypothetical protein